jgi:hypothetical protein
MKGLKGKMKSIMQSSVEVCRTFGYPLIKQLIQRTYHGRYEPKSLQNYLDECYNSIEKINFHWQKVYEDVQQMVKRLK